ncbi:hypothetical protein HWV62_19033 [Athelia sp. TMB]|nr:hypothetical protein HWV62_34373 [Athelia sp. TMB]KAF7983800.1 hypothetical protein HWV62_19033 [Athelia sp. TMB]
MAPLTTATPASAPMPHTRRLAHLYNLRLPPDVEALTDQPVADPHLSDANTTQNISGVTVAVIVTLAVLTLLLGLIIIWIWRLWHEEELDMEPREPGSHFRMPKLPDFRGQVTKGIEALSWKMEGGNRSAETKEAGKAERVSFEDNTWGTPSRSARSSRHTITMPTSPGTGVQDVPWDVPACRFSCPAALGASDADFHAEFDSRLRATSMVLNRHLSRLGTPTLETIDEEECDVFVGQQALDSFGAGFQDPEEAHLARYRDSITATYELTRGESDERIMNLTAAGMRSARKREFAARNLSRQASNASASTGTSESVCPESSSDGGSQNSSNTSIHTMITDTSESSREHEDDMSETDMGEIFEVKKVTNSMEVGKAIMVALLKARSGESIPELPSLPISNPSLLVAQHDCSDNAAGACMLTNIKSIGENLVGPTMLSDSVTISLETGESASTIDLNDFPMPPAKSTLPSITFTHSTNSGPITFSYQ